MMVWWWPFVAFGLLALVGLIYLFHPKSSSLQNILGGGMVILALLGTVGFLQRHLSDLDRQARLGVLQAEYQHSSLPGCLGQYIRPSGSDLGGSVMVNYLEVQEPDGSGKWYTPNDRIRQALEDCVHEAGGVFPRGSKGTFVVMCMTSDLVFFVCEQTGTWRRVSSTRIDLGAEPYKAQPELAAYVVYRQVVEEQARRVGKQLTTSGKAPASK